MQIHELMQNFKQLRLVYKFWYSKQKALPAKLLLINNLFQIFCSPAQVDKRTQPRLKTNRINFLNLLYQNS